MRYFLLIWEKNNNRTTTTTKFHSPNNLPNGEFILAYSARWRVPKNAEGRSTENWQIISPTKQKVRKAYWQQNQAPHLKACAPCCTLSSNILPSKTFHDLSKPHQQLRTRFSNMYIYERHSSFKPSQPSCFKSSLLTSALIMKLINTWCIGLFTESTRLCWRAHLSIEQILGVSLSWMESKGKTI